MRMSKANEIFEYFLNIFTKVNSKRDENANGFLPKIIKTIFMSNLTVF